MNEFSVEFTVRDYELDMQGIVNNSVYQNYLEHARHEYLHFHGIDFADLTERGVILVVKNISMDFKHSLRSRDQFKVVVETYKDGHLKLVFKQTIINLSNNKTALTALVTGVCLVNGKLVKPETIEEINAFLIQEAL
ncbi:MAG: acyl-CoA thioesterase [Flavobacteriaceae bacterium]